MPRELELLPVLHARRGDLVDPEGEVIDEDLRELARSFKREHGAIYVVDLDGLRRGKPDHKLLQTLAAGSPLWADTGPRHHTDVMDAMIAGAEQVTIRYHTASDETMVEEAVRLTENVALGMEFRDQELVQNPRWPSTPRELVDLAERLRLPLVVIDHARAGRAQGVDRGVAWHARHHGPGAYFAGGVQGRRDMDLLEDLGYHGALVSTALIRGENLTGAEWPGPPGAQDDEDDDPPGPPGTGLPGGIR